MSKPKRKSKTLWINGITIAVGILAIIVGADWIVEYPRLSAVLGTLVAVGNYVLRFLTYEPLGGRDGSNGSA